MSETMTVAEPARRTLPAAGAASHVRTAAVFGLAGLALHVARVASATGDDDGALGRLMVHLDMAARVIVVLGVAVAARPFVAAALERRRPPSVGRWYLRCAALLYALWFPVVVLAESMVDPGSPRRMLVSLVLFRDPRSLGPLAGLGIGAVLFVLASALVIVPWVVRLVARRGAASARSLWAAAAVLVVAGIGVRLVLVAAGRTAPFGALSWLPAHLDSVGAGLAVATLVTVGTGRLSRTRARVGATAVAALALLIAAFAAGLPTSALADGSVDLQVRALLGLVAGAGVAVATLLADRPARRPLVWLAVTAPGLLLVSEMSFLAIARQHRVRFRDGLLGPELWAPTLPILLWSTTLAAGLGVLLTVVVVIPLRGLLTGRWPRAWFPPALAAVVAGGFFVRVVTWLTIAPEKTDGGDPLFYHVTANLIASGRGMPEPLNWLDSATQVPSALHGPLYPLVLSVSSRLGGTTYIDHKFLSILIGTATVLVTALVARRVGGDKVALIAGGLAAIYPNLWLIDSLMFPEGLFALLTTSCMLVAYRWRDHPTLLAAIGLGVLIGLAALTRGEGLLLGPILAVPWMLRHRDLVLRERWKHLVIAGAACVAVLAPWTGRNLATFEEFVPLSENGNELLAYANCDETYSGRLVGYWSFNCQDEHRAQFGEPPGDRSEKARYWREVGLDYAREHADEVPRVVAIRVLRQWELFRPWQNVELSTIELRDKTSADLGLVMYYALAAGSIAGAVMLRRRGVPLLPLGAQILSVTLTAAYAYGTIRFRAPAEPVLCILAAVAALPLLRWLRRALAPPAVDPAEIPDDDPTAYVLGGSFGLRRRDRGALANWLGLGIVALVVALPLRGLYMTTGGTMEEGFMLYFPELMWDGMVPNVDFLHLYGPGALHVLMGWYEVFGYTLEAERTFGLVQHLGIIFGLYALARAWGRAAATAVAVLSTLLVLTPIGLTAMAWNGGLALVIWSAVLALRAINLGDRRPGDEHARQRRNAWLGAGALGGLALTFRPDLVIAVALVGAWLLWRHRTAWRPLLIGGLIGAIPMWVHVAMAGPVKSIEGMLLDPVLHLRAGRELPRPPSWGHLDGALQAIAEQVPPWWALPALPASISLFMWFWAMIVIAIGLVVFALWLHRRTGSRRAAVLVVGSLIGLGILPQALQRPDSTHLSWVTCISWPLAALAIVEAVRLWHPRTHPRLRVSVAALTIAGLMMAVAPLFTYRYYLHSTRVSAGNLPGAYPVERDGRRFYLGDVRPWRASRDVIAALDALAEPGERLLVGPQDLRRTWYSDVFFYWMFPELEPATYYIEMDPGLADAPGSSLADDVASADWLILTGFWNGWREPNSSMEFGPDEPNQVVDELFCEVGSFEDGLILLYRKC